ncbi:hypothetical protein D3C87_1401110 [compost metagenome]
MSARVQGGAAKVEDSGSGSFLTIPPSNRGETSTKPKGKRRTHSLAGRPDTSICIGEPSTHVRPSFRRRRPAGDHRALRPWPGARPDSPSGNRLRSRRDRRHRPARGPARRHRRQAPPVRGHGRRVVGRHRQAAGPQHRRRPAPHPRRLDHGGPGRAALADPTRPGLDL